MTKRRRVLLVLAVPAALAGGAVLLFRSGTAQAVTQGPCSADGRCPEFRDRYAESQVRFGNRGLSVLNSVYETFVDEGAFALGEFRVTTGGAGRFTIVAQSNRGPLTSEIYGDRVVRLGHDREDEALRRTLQSAFCHDGRIYEHQVVDLGDGTFTVEDLEYWTEDDALRLRFFIRTAD